MGTTLGNTSAEKPRYKCQVVGCEKAYARPARLAEHVKTQHLGQRDHVCSECGTAFFRAQHLQAHITFRHETGGSFACDACGKRFKTQWHLRRHAESHVTADVKGAGVCAVCGAGVPARAMRRHLLEAHGQKPYRCTVAGCTSSFSTPSRLQRHVAARHRDSTDGDAHECTLCGAKYASVRALQAHMRTAHVCTCSECGKTFSRASNFRQHLETHAGHVDARRQFVCEHAHCGRAFTRVQALHVHVKSVHEGEKPFPCLREGCSMRFAHKASLLRHEQRIHDRPPPAEPGPAPSEEEQMLDMLSGVAYERDRPYACEKPQCSYRFARRYDLQRHMRISHGASSGE